MSCADCADLQEENRQLRRELAYALDAEAAARLQSAFGVTPQEAELIAVLNAAKGRLLMKWHVAEALPSINGPHDRIDPVNLVNVLVCRIRKRLGFDFVENVKARGVRLSDAARARCAAILAQAQQVAA